MQAGLPGSLWNATLNQGELLICRGLELSVENLPKTAGVEEPGLIL